MITNSGKRPAVSERASMRVERRVASGEWRRFAFAAFLIGFFVVAAPNAAPQQPAAPQKPAAPVRPQKQVIFRSNLELVLVNVVVHDKDGNVVKNLKRDDFTVVEDGRTQTVSTFDQEDLPTVATPAETAVPTAPPAKPILVTPPSPTSPAAPASSPAPVVDMHGKRLLVFFFDVSSMQPEEIERAITSARQYVQTKLTPADMVAVVSLSTSLQVEVDFTDNRQELLQVLGGVGDASAQAFAEGTTADSTSVSDTGADFTPDDSEFNIFNTDRRLEALQSLAEALSGIQQKKSIIYFSSGMSRTGQDNEVQLRSVVDKAIRANVSIYAADMRGLQAIVPGGDATSASVRGTSAFSGASMRNQFDRTFASQETLSTLAEDTGGRAFFDSNEFAGVFDRVVADTSSYYVLGYSSTNEALDGRFRRIQVRVKLPGAKVEYRKGYYAGKDFVHANKDDREQNLQDQLLSPLSSTDLDLFLSAGYFRLDKDRYYVPVSLVVPGSQVPTTHAGDKDKATLDILGLVRDVQSRPVGRIRDTIRLQAGEGEVGRKNVQYSTAFQLPPGKYTFKAVVRENQDGVVGSYETEILVPDLSKEPVKVSTVVLGTQMRAGVKGDQAKNPLVENGQELVPNVAHVVSTAQQLHFYYEVYDPTAPKDAAERQAGEKGHILTNVTLYRSGVRVYETPMVEATQPNATDRHANVFDAVVPPGTLQPGYYICQVNVIDDVAGTFAFPRLALYVRR
jgi:VWFA-related protein